MSVAAARIALAPLTVLLALAAVISGCAQASAGCTKDNECRGDRVCEHSRCVDPEDDHPRGGLEARYSAEVEAQRRVELGATLDAVKAELSACHAQIDRGPVESLKCGEDLKKAQLELELCKATQPEPPGKPLKPRVPCKCLPSDPLCDC
jgi:hypothetical protein